MLTKKYVCSKYSDQHTVCCIQHPTHKKRCLMFTNTTVWTTIQVFTIGSIQNEAFDKYLESWIQSKLFRLRLKYLIEKIMRHYNKSSLLENLWYQSDSFNMKRTSLNQSKSIGHFKTTPNQNTKNFQKDVLVTFHLWFELSSF